MDNEASLLLRDGHSDQVANGHQSHKNGYLAALSGTTVAATDRAHDEASLTQHVADLQALYDLSSQISHAEDSRQIYEHALRTLRNVMGTDRAAMHALESHGTVRSFVAWAGLSARYRKELNGVSPWPPDVVDPAAITLADVGYATAARKLPTYLRKRLAEVLPALQREGIGALAFIPIFKTRMKGFLSVQYREPHEFTDRELRLAQTVAGPVAFALDRQHAEEALEASETRFRSLVQNATDITAVLEADGTIRYGSPSTLKILGYEPAELVGRRVFEYMHPEDLTPVAQALSEAAEEGANDLPPTPVELRMRHRDGSWRYLEAVGTNLLEDQSIRGIVVNARDITDRKRIEALVTESEQRFRDLFENANDMVYTRDLEGCITDVNKMGQRLTGYSRDELLGRLITDFVRETTPESAMMTVANAPLPEDDDEADIVEIIRKDGSVIPVEVRARLIWMDGQAVAVQGIARDISERRDAERALIASEERFRSLVQNALDVIAVLSPEGVITYISPSIERISGYSVEEMTGRSVFEFFSAKDMVNARDQLSRSLKDRDHRGEVELRVRHRDGSYRYLEGSSRNMFDDPAIAGFVINARDISERRRFEQELQRQAFYEPLTELPNRALFMDRLRHALANRERSKDIVAVLFLDLDRFKIINDSLGHAVGDQLLVAVGERLRTTLRPGDTVARFGGDEFTILLEGLHFEADATQVAQRVIDDLRAPFTLRGQEMFTSASIGLAFAGKGPAHADALLRDADVALYKAKDEGRSRYVVFDQEMNLRAAERLDIANDLRHAVAAGKIRVHYQPEVDLATGRLLGFEALARWKHPRFGDIAPSEFIRMAEDSGLILTLGHSILKRACRQLRRWQTKVGPHNPLSMSVNFSARQLQQVDIVDQIGAILAANHLDPASLIVELTEGIAVGEDAVIADRLDGLRRLGVRVAIDDFGAGYTSLSYLTRVNADILKIDISFINGIDLDSGKAAIVRALITLAHGFGLSVTAEGVERESQLEKLRAAGCERGQGFLFSRPLPAEAAGRLLRVRSLLP